MAFLPFLATPGRSLSTRNTRRFGITDGPMARVHALVEGVVQGVGFRWFTMKHARHLSVQGWVRNLADGRVELVAEGSREQLEQLLARVREGPPGSRVRNVITEWSEASGEFAEFQVSG